MQVTCGICARRYESDGEKMCAHARERRERKILQRENQQRTQATFDELGELEQQMLLFEMLREPGHPELLLLDGQHRTQIQPDLAITMVFRGRYRLHGNTTRVTVIKAVQPTALDTERQPGFRTDWGAALQPGLEWLLTRETVRHELWS